MKTAASLFIFFSLAIGIFVFGNIIIVAQQPKNQSDITINAALKNQVIEELLEKFE